jgi:hypothetical protein
MTNAEREAALQEKFDRVNWSMRIEKREGFERISVFNLTQTLVGVITLNEGGGYHCEPKHHDDLLRRTFYRVVDGVLSEGP